MAGPHVRWAHTRSVKTVHAVASYKFLLLSHTVQLLHVRSVCGPATATKVVPEVHGLQPALLLTNCPTLHVRWAHTRSIETVHAVASYKFLLLSHTVQGLHVRSVCGPASAMKVDPAEHALQPAPLLTNCPALHVASAHTRLVEAEQTVVST